MPLNAEKTNKQFLWIIFQGRSLVVLQSLLRLWLAGLMSPYAVRFFLYRRFLVWLSNAPAGRSNQIKSNHFYCHITTAQVPWWVKFLWACSRQCRKTTDNLHMDRQSKKTTNNLHMDRQCKKTTNNLHMDRQCKKLHWSIYSAPDSAKKQQQQFTYGQTVQKKQQQFTYGQYIFTDCTEDNVQNTHTCTQYA